MAPPARSARTSCGTLLARTVAVAAVLVGAAIFVGNAPPMRPLACHALQLACPPLLVRGHVKAGWEPVLAKYAEVFADGYELGAQLSVYHKNEHVIDATLGYADPSFTAPFDNATLQIVFSSTKVIESLVIAMLVDRGLLRYEDRIAQHWPEFAQGGKQDVTVGDLMVHAGGVSSVQYNSTMEHFEDDRRGGDAFGKLLAAMPLEERSFRQKGTQGYHAISRGFYTSHICRRVDPKHRILADFARDEIFRPLGLADFTMGVHPDSPLWRRVGPVFGQPKTKVVFGFIPRLLLPPWLTRPFFSDHFITDDERACYLAMGKQNSVTWDAFDAKALFGKAVTVPDFGKQPYASIESPSSHGFTNAHTLARIAQVLLNGGTDPVTGTVLLSKATVDYASEYQPFVPDTVLLDRGISFTRGGFGQIVTRSSPIPEIENSCVGWGGAGGSVFQWCPAERLSFVYVMNYYAPHILDWRGRDYLVEAVKVARGLNAAA